MIKAIIRKELRENYKLALAGAGVFGLIIAMNVDRTNPPLMEEIFQTAASFFCGIFGALLGFLQIRRESHPDLRAFLIHRPLSRTGIFVGKVIAGLGLYFVSAGVPIICLTLLVRVPGQVAAPFEWGMILPVTATYLAGIVCYFAGMVARQPQARWPVSRVLALGAGILAMAWRFYEFWPALVLVIVSTAILGTAAWGGFVSNGDSRRNPVAAGITLPIAMVPGAAMVLAVAVSLFVDGVIRPKPIPQTYSVTYKILTDGTVAKYSTASWGNTLTDPNGQLIKNPASSNVLGPSNYLGAEAVFLRSAPSSVMPLLPQPGANGWSSFRDSGRFCRVVFGGAPVQWFYSFTLGRFLGYDVHSHEFVGSFGPEGLAANSQAPGERFNPGNGNDNNQVANCIADTHTVFILTPRQATGTLTSRPLFSVPTNESIVATTEIMSNVPPELSGVQLGTLQNVVHMGMMSIQAATAVVTSQCIYVISPAGEVLWKLPRPKDFSGDTTLQLFLTKTPDQCVLMLTPSDAAFRKSQGKLPTRLEFFDRDSTLTKTLDLPTLGTPGRPLALEEKLVGFVLPWITRFFAGSGAFYLPAWNLLISALCAVAAFALGLRARLGVRAQIGWVIFLLLTGVGGFLTFLCLQTWPARDRCPNCRKLRVVNRDCCEHCGAAFAPAEKNGTEIFEPLGTPDSRPA